MIKTATIIRHTRSDPSGTISRVLRERGIGISEYGAPFESLAPVNPLTPDLLVVMGGSCGVYQADLYPFLNDELSIIRARLANNRPVLGICLGSQLMAAALGAEVFKGPQGPEKGWQTVQINEAGRKTPVRHFDGAFTPVMQWHGDTFTKPPGATILAGSALYEHQIFQAGQHAFGLQFHPELDEEIMQEWCVEAAYDAYSGKIDLTAMRAQGEKNLPLMAAQTSLFLNEWLDQLGGN